jgi:hypothetical protein
MTNKVSEKMTKSELRLANSQNLFIFRPLQFHATQRIENKYG